MRNYRVTGDDVCGPENGAACPQFLEVPGRRLGCDCGCGVREWPGPPGQTVGPTGCPHEEAASGTALPVSDGNTKATVPGGGSRSVSTTRNGRSRLRQTSRSRAEWRVNRPEKRREAERDRD